jgi:AcrR family transcriptional regulator
MRQHHRYAPLRWSAPSSAAGEQGRAIDKAFPRQILVCLPTKKFVMRDRRHQIIEAGLATLREYGYGGFTQPRVAARAGLRQSHLTYYHPTRLDLLAAVGRAAVDRQLAAVDAMIDSVASADAAANAIAGLITRHSNTRVLMALAQAGDEEPRLRELFRELADGIVERVAQSFLNHQDPAKAEVPARLLHALSVGLAVVDLATGRPDGQQRAAAILDMAMRVVLHGSAQASQALPAPRNRHKGERP